ncbi:MAG: glycosyltransferase family 2 protein [Cyclobacteriaceae bacterium]
MLVNIVVILLHISAQLFTLYDSKPTDQDVAGISKGKVTIHVPIHNEPPDVVIQTLTYLSHIEYDDYEVIVLDNNTTDENLYLPIKHFCDDHRDFRFYHFDKVSGYKAGALNLCNKLSDPRTQFYLIVDSDYCVSERIIQEGLGEFTDSSVGLVQFPQSYRNSRTKDCGLMMDFSYYFDLVLNKANQFNCPLPTGTLTFIRKETLDKLGGWKTSSITEDAELGLHLYKNKYRIKYSPKIVGKGLAPYDYNVLRKQRQRWIFGNFQILLNYLGSRETMNITFIYGFFLQLTAWLNFAGLSFILLLVSSVMELVNPQPYYPQLQYLALAGIVLHMLGKFILYMGYAGINKRYSYRTAAKAWLIHLSLMYDGAFCWWKLLLGKRLPFITTAKLHLNKKFELSYHAFIIPILLAFELLVLGRTGFSGVAITSAILFLLYVTAPVLFLKKIKTNKYPI